jgi:hypothetical protein
MDEEEEEQEEDSFNKIMKSSIASNKAYVDPFSDFGSNQGLGFFA